MVLSHISDTHNRHNKLTLPEADILCITGDISGQGYKGEVELFFNWLHKINTQYKWIIFITGNHDKCFDPKFGINNPYWEETGVLKIRPHWVDDLVKLLPENVYYLEDSGVELDGIRFYGSPWTPWFHGDHWAFNAYRGEGIKYIWDKIPLNTDILLTHGPAAYRGDYTQDGIYAGCEDLRYAVKMVKPKLHLFGHIHEAYGISYDENTIYSNGSTCNLNYEPVNLPLIHEI